MSWLYSRALVEAFSAATCSAGARYALSSASHTPRAFLPPDRMTAFSRPSRFGMTFGPLTDDLGGELLTWFLEASRVRTSASPVKALDSMASALDYGARWRALLAKFDRDSSSWRTAQRSLLGDSGESFQTWPRSGMTADGQCWELPMLERRTSETDSGLWLTPCATDAKPITGGNLYQTATGTVRHMRPDGRSSNRGLAAQVTWPTPTAMTDTGGAAMCKCGGSGSLAKLKKIVTPEELNGALNPTWVEWLMGWPLGWTDLGASETDKSPYAPQSHGQP